MNMAFLIEKAEISYSLRYPEYKPSENRWTIRQSGIYHKYDCTTSQSTYVLFSPTSQSKAHCKADEWLHNAPSEAQTNPFWLHSVLFSVYSPAWRHYIAAFEQRFLPLANAAFATFIDEPLSLGHDHLITLTNLESRFLQIPTILASATDIVDELCALLGPMPHQTAMNSEIEHLRNQRRLFVTYSRIAAHLQLRVQSVAKLLAETLLLRDQVIAGEQNKNIFQLNKSAYFITILTLLYLPSSFMAVSISYSLLVTASSHYMFFFYFSGS